MEPRLVAVMESNHSACEERPNVKLMLDTKVLIEVCIPGRHKDAKEWFRRLLLAPSPPELLASVISD